MKDLPERIWAWKWSDRDNMGQWADIDPREWIGKDSASTCFEAVSATLFAATLTRAEKAEAELASGSFYQEKDIDALMDRAERAEAERDEWRSDFRALEKAIVGETGLSAMTVATQARLFKPRAEKAQAALAEAEAAGMRRAADHLRKQADIITDQYGKVLLMTHAAGIEHLAATLAKLETKP